jgi:hypothetical protein
VGEDAHFDSYLVDSQSYAPELTRLLSSPPNLHLPDWKKVQIAMITCWWSGATKLRTSHERKDDTTLDDLAGKSRDYCWLDYSGATSDAAFDLVVWGSMSSRMMVMMMMNVSIA